MPKTWTAIAVAALVAATIAPAAGQDVRPLSPVLRPADERPGEGGGDAADGAVVPLPRAASRAASADAARARVAVLPTTWTDVATRWQPLWVATAPPNAFGVERWSSWFAAAGFAPRVEPHPFFSPWGLFSYEGWVFDRYRSAWTGVRTDGRFAEAADWLRRGDRAMLEGRNLDAATAYRRATLAVPEMPHGYLGLGAALAAMGEDAAAAQALRQSVDRWPAWLPLDVGWVRLWGGDERLDAAVGAARERAATGAEDSRFVAGALCLFGGRVEEGREILGGLGDDHHAGILLSRGPR